MSAEEKRRRLMAVEKSPNRDQIEAWFVKGKSVPWIHKNLKEKFGEYISVNSIQKYSKFRRSKIEAEMHEQSDYTQKMRQLESTLIAKTEAIKEVDIQAGLNDILNYNAELLQQAKHDEIRIKSAQEIRFVQQSMIDAYRLRLEALEHYQKYNAIEKNPDLLRPTTNIQMTETIRDAISEIIAQNGFAEIDRLRAMNAQQVEIIEGEAKVEGE